MSLLLRTPKSGSVGGLPRSRDLSRACRQANATSPRRDHRSPEARPTPVSTWARPHALRATRPNSRRADHRHDLRRARHLLILSSLPKPEGAASPASRFFPDDEECEACGAAVVLVSSSLHTASIQQGGPLRQWAVTTPTGVLLEGDCFRGTAHAAASVEQLDAARWPGRDGPQRREGVTGIIDFECTPATSPLSSAAGPMCGWPARSPMRPPGGGDRAGLYAGLGNHRPSRVAGR